MENNFANSDFSLCRLCHVCGPHKINIMADDQCILNHILFKHYGVLVEATDKSTKICEKCLNAIHGFIRTRKICAETSFYMKNSRGGIFETNSGNSANNKTKTPRASFISEARSSYIVQNPVGLQLSKEEVQKTTPVPNYSLVEQKTLVDDRKCAVIDLKVKKEEPVTPVHNSTYTGAPMNIQVSAAPATNDICSEIVSFFAGHKKEKTKDFRNDNDEYRRREHHQSTEHNCIIPLNVAVPLNKDELKNIGRHAEMQIDECPTKSAKKLTRKMVKRIPRFLYKCGLCANLFKSTDEREYHRTRYHAKTTQTNRKQFECHLCKRPFRILSNLVGHMNTTHVGLKPFVCPFQTCLWPFGQKVHLKSHINVVHGNSSKKPRIEYIPFDANSV